MARRDGLPVRDITTDLDAATTQCPACLTTFSPRGTNRCPECNLRFH